MNVKKAAMLCMATLMSICFSISAVCVCYADVIAVSAAKLADEGSKTDGALSAGSIIIISGLLGVLISLLARKKKKKNGNEDKKEDETKSND